MNDIESILTDALHITIFSVGEFSENDLVKSVAGRIGHITLTQTDIANLVSDLSAINSEIDGKADIAHTHDDRYFTESEVTALLAGKSDTSHLHDDRYFTESEVTALLAGKSDTSHLHDDRYFTESEITALLAGKSNVGHGHGIADVTSLQAILDNKASRQFALYANNLTFNFFGYRVGFGTLTANATFSITNLPSYEVCYIHAYNSHSSAVTITKQSGYISTNWGDTYDLAAGDYITFMLYTDGTNKYITKVPALTDFAAVSHSHVISNVTGLQAALDAKQNIVDSVGTFTNTGALNFTGISRANVSINANVTLTVSGMSAGEEKKIRFYNSHASSLVTITNPTASNWILQRGLTTVTLLAGEYVKASIYFDGTNYELIYGEAMLKNA